MIEEDRKKEMQKIVKRMQKDFNKLKKLNYIISDRASTVTIFDASGEGEWTPVEILI